MRLRPPPTSLCTELQRPRHSRATLPSVRELESRRALGVSAVATRVVQRGGAARACHVQHSKSHLLICERCAELKRAQAERQPEAAPALRGSPLRHRAQAACDGNLARLLSSPVLKATENCRWRLSRRQEEELVAEIDAARRGAAAPGAAQLQLEIDEFFVFPLRARERSKLESKEAKPLEPLAAAEDHQIALALRLVARVRIGGLQRAGNRRNRRRVLHALAAGQLMDGAVLHKQRASVPSFRVPS